MPFTGSARFQLLDKLGEGGRGIVYEAYDQVREMRVALKTLRKVDAVELYHFKREFRALRDLSHPNIITLYELVSDNEDWFLTMEIVAGCDFMSYVRGGRAPASSDPSSTRGAHSGSDTDTATLTLVQDAEMSKEERHAVAISGVPSPPAQPRAVDAIVDIDRLRGGMVQLARALHALHWAGIVHRDLKPSNVYVTGEGRVVLMDFGIVAEMSMPLDPQQRSTIMGTPSFMAPEQSSGAQPSPAADWYAFGVMLYLALSGRLPFEGAARQVIAAKRELDPWPLDRFVSGAPGELIRLCENVLRRDPAQRATGAEILAALGVTASEATHSITIAPARDADIFIGRRRELAELHDAYASVPAGRARCVLVTGPSGIGKSSLLDRFLRQVVNDDPRVTALASRCHEGESLPYKAFDTIIDGLSGVLLDLPASERAALLPRSVGAITQLFPTFSRVPGCDPGMVFLGQNSIDIKHRAVEALRGLLAALATAAPVVLRIEDLQWADRDSLELMSSLLEPPVPRRLMMLITICSQDPARQRPGDTDGPAELCLAPLTLEASGRLRTVTMPSDQSIEALIDTLTERGILHRLELGPLSGYEQRELVFAMARRNSHAASLTDEVWREAAGYPMLLSELARYAEEAPDEVARTLEEDSTAEPRPGESSAAHALGSIIWRRISGLSELPRDLLYLIAVAGGPMPLRVVGEAARLSDTARERAWSILRIARLARRVPRADRQLWVDTYHHKMREVILDRLDAEALTARHRLIAQALEEWQEAPGPALAHHWISAGHIERGLRYLVDAAENAGRQLAFDRAAELYHAALAYLPGPGSTDATDRDRAGVSDTELETLRCRIWLGLIDEMRLTERNDEALELLDRAEKLAEGYQLVKERALVHHLRGNILFPRGDAQACLLQHERARHYARAAGSLEHEIRALGGLGDAYFASGRMLSAFEHYDACVKLSRANGFVSVECAHLSHRGWTRSYRLELEAGLEDCQDCIATAMSIDHPRAEAMARGWYGMILIETGRDDEACDEVERSLTILRRLGTRRFELAHQGFLGRVLAMAGRRAEAQDLLIDVLDHQRPDDVSFAGPIVLGALAVATREHDVLASALDRGEALLRVKEIGFNYMFFYRDALAASYRAGDVDRLERYTRELDRVTSVEPSPWSQFFVAWGRALSAHLRTPRDEGSLAELRRLEAEAGRSGLRAAAAVLEKALRLP